MIKEAEIAIVGAVTKALELLEKNPLLSSEEIIQAVMSSVSAKSDAKIYAVAAVNDAINIRRKNSKLGDKQIVQQVVNEYKESLRKSFE